MHHGYLSQSSRFEDAEDAATARMGFSSQVHMTEHPPMEITVRESGSIPVLEVRGRLTIGEPSES